MSVKNVVKVMNFHSLLRVDKSRRLAEQYFDTERELTKMINGIVYNRNLVLDKKTLVPNPKKPKLNIYIGNDYGFCGNFNSAITESLKKDQDNFKIIIGKKILYRDDKTILAINKEDFKDNLPKIEQIIYDAIRNMSYSEINVIYNHYYSVNNLGFVKACLFPVEFKEEENNNYTEDFVIETDINEMLVNLVSLYICYEIRIREANSNASENVMREGVTRESLKKIDEIETETKRVVRKQNKYHTFKKNIENYQRRNFSGNR